MDLFLSQGYKKGKMTLTKQEIIDLDTEANPSIIWKEGGLVSEPIKSRHTHKLTGSIGLMVDHRDHLHPLHDFLLPDDPARNYPNPKKKVRAKGDHVAGATRKEKRIHVLDLLYDFQMTGMPWPKAYKGRTPEEDKKSE